MSEPRIKDVRRVRVPVLEVAEKVLREHLADGWRLADVTPSAPMDSVALLDDASLIFHLERSERDA